MNTVKELAKVPAKTNGTTTAPAVAPTAKPTAQQTTAAVVDLPPVKMKSADELQPLEDRLHRLNILFGLQTKLTKLQDSQKKLADFEINQNKENSDLTISDDDGSEFSTSNPVVIAAVVELIKKTITEKSAELAAKIIL